MRFEIGDEGLEALLERGQRRPQTQLVRLDDRIRFGAQRHDPIIETREPGHRQQLAARRVEKHSVLIVGAVVSICSVPDPGVSPLAEVALIALPAASIIVAPPGSASALLDASARWLLFCPDATV